MIPLLKFSVRSHFRMWHRHREAQRRSRAYQRELCGFNAERWKRHYGSETFGKGLAEIFSNP